MINLFNVRPTTLSTRALSLVLLLATYLILSPSLSANNDANDIEQSETQHGKMKHAEMQHGEMKNKPLKHSHNRADETKHNKIKHAKMNHGAHGHNPVDVANWPAIPSLTLTAHKDLASGWNLHITTKAFSFAPDRVNTPNKVGEGHAHLYINGSKATRVYSNWFYVDDLPVGNNTITVTLNANDHGALSYRGDIIAASIEVLQE